MTTAVSIGSERFAALGTTAVLLVADPSQLAPATAILREHLAAVDHACSRFRADSELSALNTRAGDGPVAVSELLCEAVSVALEAALATDGRVDPTVGTAMRVLGYDRDFASVAADGGPLLVTARAVPGWRAVKVDRRRRTITLPHRVELDLGATAKALCADRATAAIAAATGVGVLVSLGGDIAVAGEAPNDGWAVRVTDDHAAPPDAPGQTVIVQEGGLATSSTAVRRWQRGGEVLHHVVDPATGRPAGSDWRTVSVAADSCVAANTATTAAIVMGPGGPAWLEASGLPARLVAQDGTVTMLGGWPLPEAPGC